VQATERRADGGAVRLVWREDRRAVHARDETGRLAVERAEQRAGPVGNRRRALDATPREVRHQVEIERQLVRRQALVERQHEPALGRRDEVVRVFDARGDRRLQDESADRIAGQPGFQFFGGNGRIDRHRASRRASSAPAQADIRKCLISARPAARRALTAPSGGSERSERGGPKSARPAARRALTAPPGGSERSERGGRSFQFALLGRGVAAVAVAGLLLPATSIARMAPDCSLNTA